MAAAVSDMLPSKSDRTIRPYILLLKMIPYQNSLQISRPSFIASAIFSSISSGEL